MLLLLILLLLLLLEQHSTALSNAHVLGELLLRPSGVYPTKEEKMRAGCCGVRTPETAAVGGSAVCFFSTIYFRVKMVLIIDKY